MCGQMMDTMELGGLPVAGLLAAAMLLVLFAALVSGALMLLRPAVSSGHASAVPRAPRDTAVEALKDRWYARGEIDEEEFHRQLDLMLRR